ncbi:peptidoglycan-binding protein [Streptomyces sp. NPDC051569]|uniref:peptidoglycan-binding protein n=1 Tax=Streptomyces sp. NPDC051569 TaxID=3365661 RepID=UPI0037896989
MNQSHRMLAVAVLAGATLISAGASADAATARPAQHTTPVKRTVAQPRDLREGARGEAVKVLQRQLISLGYRLKAEGIFGPVTDRDVRDFQRTHHLTPDGVVGPRTRAALRGGHRTRAAATSALRNEITYVARGQVTRTGSHPAKSGACAKYFPRTKYPRNGYNSCNSAVFAEWTWHRAGVRSLPHTLAARAIGKWGVREGLFHRSGPKPGDLVIYGRPDGRSPGHAGVVVAVHRNGTLDTVDGNYGNRVVLLRRVNPAVATANYRHVSGYVSPPLI